MVMIATRTWGGVYDLLNCPHTDLFCPWIALYTVLINRKGKVPEHPLAKTVLRNHGLTPCTLYQFILGQGNTFLPESSEFLCPECQKGILIFRDYCNRIIRYEDGSHDWVKIPRHRCYNLKCRRLHRMLPDVLLLHKHYLEETISGVLDGVIEPDDADSENCPSEKTMFRWKHWFMFNQLNMDGQMRSIGCRVLGFNEELLRSSVSLLCHIRSSIPNAWLKIIIRYIYNSGSTLQAFY